MGNLERLQGWNSKKRLRRRSSLRFIDRRLLMILGLLGFLSAVQLMREGPSAFPRVNAFGGSPSQGSGFFTFLASGIIQKR